ncbi:hotdog fold thioesterase [Xanthobacter oligotrophicus]|uniref:Hotdog fold thioesterase n=1 Tax=Xanthobacter oligotrophicus TaxID=2607286 RepID=A0ABW7A4K4_9HYPH
MEILEICPGTATLTMTVDDRMYNGFGATPGGVIFTLADRVFAFSCNSHDARTVGAHYTITLLRPDAGRKRLIARAVSRAGRSGIYDVEVNEDEMALLANHIGDYSVFTEALKVDGGEKE